MAIGAAAGAVNPAIAGERLFVVLGEFPFKIPAFVFSGTILTLQLCTTSDQLLRQRRKLRQTLPGFECSADMTEPSGQRDHIAKMHVRLLGKCFRATIGYLAWSRASVKYFSRFGTSDEKCDEVVVRPVTSLADRDAAYAEVAKTGGYEILTRHRFGIHRILVHTSESDRLSAPERSMIPNASYWPVSATAPGAFAQANLKLPQGNAEFR